MLLLFSNSLVLIGAAILLGSLITVRKIVRQLPLGRSRTSWYAMASMILLFVIGYLGYASIFWGQHTRVVDLIVPGVFFFGACFVWLSSILALQTAMDVMRITSLEKETFTDPLTGVYNRRYMEKRLQEEVAKAVRYGFELAVMMLDLDRFKALNDERGHQSGDQVLIETGRILVQELRDTDILARYGGEEFFAIVPNTGPTDAAKLARRLCQRIESFDFLSDPENDRVQPVRVTVSIGVASFGDDVNSEESLIRLADTRLYQAKAEGRNRVVSP